MVLKNLYSEGNLKIIAYQGRNVVKVVKRGEEIGTHSELRTLKKWDTFSLSSIQYVFGVRTILPSKCSYQLNSFSGYGFSVQAKLKNL